MGLPEWSQSYEERVYLTSNRYKMPCYWIHAPPPSRRCMPIIHTFQTRKHMQKLSPRFRTEEHTKQIYLSKLNTQSAKTKQNKKHFCPQKKKNEMKSKTKILGSLEEWVGVASAPADGREGCFTCPSLNPFYAGKKSPH